MTTTKTDATTCKHWTKYRNIICKPVFPFWSQLIVFHDQRETTHGVPVAKWSESECVCVCVCIWTNRSNGLNWFTQLNISWMGYGGKNWLPSLRFLKKSINIRKQLSINSKLIVHPDTAINQLVRMSKSDAQARRCDQWQLVFANCQYFRRLRL